MALVSRELAIIMLVTAALGVIGVFPLISSALMAAQALLWLQQTSGSPHSHAIYCIAIATIVFALIQIIVIIPLSIAAVPAFNYRAIFGGAGPTLATFANSDGSINVKFKSASNLCGGYTIDSRSGTLVSSYYDLCPNGVGRMDGFYRWALSKSAFNDTVCVEHIAWSSLGINRIKAESAVAAASFEGAYAKVRTGDA
jgi:hypothetical protein